MLLAETLLAADPVASISKLRLFGELLAQEAAAPRGLADAAHLSAEERANLEASERAAADELMAEVGQREAEMVARLAKLQQSMMNAAPATVSATIAIVADTASLDLNEASTRHLIDAELRAAGWEVGWSEGVRPQKGKNVAIAEVPTDAGPADYVLFAGLTPLAVVEAKRRDRNLAEVLKQSARDSRGFHPSTAMTPASRFADAEREPHVVPFLFSANGRPYLRQVAELRERQSDPNSSVRSARS